MSILASARQTGLGAGELLSSVTRSVGLGGAEPWLRPGETLGARLFRHGTTPAVGVAWLDEAGVDEALVRLTCSGSLTGGSPVVTGLALRLPQPDGSVGDVLFRAPARAARGPWGAAAARRPGRGTLLTTGAAYLSDSGLVTLAARQCGIETFELSCLAGEGEWQHVGDLRVCALRTGLDPFVTDPAGNQVPGLEPAAWAPGA